MATKLPSFDTALAHFRAGRLQHAEVACRDLLLEEPLHAPALHMLGLLAIQVNQAEQAVGYLLNAITVDPQQAAFHNSLGEAYRALDLLDEAKQSFERALELDSNLPAAHFNLALHYRATGHKEEAIAAFRRVLLAVPSHAETYNHLGSLLHELKDYDNAERHFQQAVSMRPDLVEAHNNLGNLLQERGQINQAIAAFERALALLPNSPQVHYNLANALRNGGQSTLAVDHYRQATTLAPNFAQAHNNLGTLLEALNDWDAAAESLSHAIEVAPSFVEARFNLGVLLQKCGEADAAAEQYRKITELDAKHASARFNLGTVLQGRRRWEEAREWYLKALDVRPDYVGPLCNLGIMCQALGNDEEALAYFDKALAIQSDCAEAHCDRAMLRLGQGDFAAGWPEFQWHTQTRAFCRRAYPRPPWKGTRLVDRRILIHCQQGMGDTMQFVRYLPWVRQFGPEEVLLAAQPALHPLLDSSGLGRLVDPDDPALDFDTQVSLMSLPILAHAAGEPIPNRVPYLRSTPDLVEHWRQKLAAIDGFRVGISWQGNPSYVWDHLRSIPLAEFEPLAKVERVRLISLQQGDGLEQLPAARQRFDILDLGDDVDRRHGAFMDTAAILQTLDLLITSDTAVAHLAGALGVPVWLALSKAPEWRWQRSGETSPWYPSMRLFRQAAWNDWTELFGRIATELQQTARPDRATDNSSIR